MKLPFEEWITQRQYRESVMALFKEAFICYRNTAYRASFLFSYLGFMTIIKETIIKSAKPASIPQSRWDNILRHLQNDDTWEKMVFDELTNSTSPIFNINENIRQQVKYWKDRRNDCAHYKFNDIDSFHTESLWSFVKSNLLKISIEGSEANLLNKLEKHFDARFTPPDKDISPLAREIDDAIEPANLTNFWGNLYNSIDLIGLTYFGESEYTKVVKAVFEHCSATVRESLADYLKVRKHDLYIVHYYPEKINLLHYSPTEIRQIWMARIWENKSSAFSIFGTLLRNSLIPKNEIEEANLHLLSMGTDYRPTDDPTHLALAGNGFGDTIFNIAFREKRLTDWQHFVNPRADMIAYYVEKYPLREETVEIICEMYARPFYSWWLAERLTKIFTDRPSIKSEFHKVAARRGLTVPQSLS